MRCIVSYFFLASSTLATPSFASPLTPDWSNSAVISPSGRANPYGWDEATLQSKIRAGKLHALNYPVEVTGLLVPARPAMKILNAEPGDPIFIFLKTLLSFNSEFRNFKGFWDWVGLHPYPDTDSEIPYPGEVKPDYPMGVSFIEHNGARGVTLSCAACHSAELFGKPILGLTNRFPRSNEFFIYGKKTLRATGPGIFSLLTNATPEEREMFRDSREKIASVGLKKPETLGLDTSLAQVALSLSRRAETPWAERDPASARNPRDNLLDHMVADSKPAPWWNTKYKTRWLSDGSVVSGNPVFTNFLWNEIGRGVDLPELVDWLQKNSNIVEELTTAVFATKAPKWSEYLDSRLINVTRARHGEKLFQVNCQKCHGEYVKSWPKIETVKVNYFSRTGVVDVGTDSGRREGMQALQDGLNPLAFSKQFQIVIQKQAGYVPPPLEAIFSRYPYLHNNSIPNLCALMTKPENRPKTYYARAAIDPATDFDSTCVGYPANATNTDEYFYDTSREGMSNSGHFERIFTNSDGSEKFTDSDKQDLREFLKTL